MGRRTQKSPKTADPGAKQRNQVDLRSCWHRTTSEEEAGAGTVPHVPTREACVVLARNSVAACGAYARGFRLPDFGLLAAGEAS